MWSVYLSHCDGVRWIFFFCTQTTTTTTRRFFSTLLLCYFLLLARCPLRFKAFAKLLRHAELIRPLNWIWIVVDTQHHRRHWMQWIDSCSFRETRCVIICWGRKWKFGLSLNGNDAINVVRLMRWFRFIILGNWQNNLMTSKIGWNSNECWSIVALISLLLLLLTSIDAVDTNRRKKVPNDDSSHLLTRSFCCHDIALYVQYIIFRRRCRSPRRWLKMHQQTFKMKWIM